MIGRYVVELLLILLCGMGLHAAEVFGIGGAGTLAEFKKVGLDNCVTLQLLQDTDVA